MKKGLVIRTQRPGQEQTRNPVGDGIPVRISSARQNTFPATLIAIALKGLKGQVVAASRAGQKPHEIFPTQAAIQAICSRICTESQKIIPLKPPVRREIQS
jgi:hypothetical protein